MRDVPEHRVDRSELIRIRGGRVRVRVQGDGDPLLLLNGFTRPMESWGPFIAALGDRTVVTFDAPGVGGSPTPVLPLSMSRLAALAVSVLDAAGLGTADVLGFSYGGAVAQQLAFTLPDRVRRLVLVSTSCGVGAIPSTRATPGSLRRPADAGSWPRAHALGSVWQSLGISGWSSIPFLGAIRAPTLVVCGTRDRVVPPGNSAVLAQRIPGAELVMLPAGHDLQRPGPAGLLISTVEPFLAAGAGVEAPVGGYPNARRTSSED